MQAENHRRLIPIACRFVPYDQWFTTHLDNDWKVKQVKHWILSKCNLIEAPDPPARRPVSPITFASTLRTRISGDSLDDGYHKDDEYDDDSEDDYWSRFPELKRQTLYSRMDAKQGPSTQSMQHGNYPLVDRYTLMSFSNGTLLEDDFTLSWYSLRPYELLEMHRSGAIVPLPRDTMAEYVQPYFEAKVKALGAIWNSKFRRFEVPVSANLHELDSAQGKEKHGQLDRKRRKAKLEWKDRWIVMHQGVFSLFTEPAGGTPVQQFSLATLKALRGAESLERACSIINEQRVVCANFRTMQPKLGLAVASMPPSAPSSPLVDDYRTSTTPSRIPASGSGQEDSQKPSATRDHGSGDVYRDEGEWVVLDMLDDHALSNILRILHRYAPHPISSSFLPSSSIITVANSYAPDSSLEILRSPHYDTIPYPEWRINTAENARKAGMGDVGRPMAWVLWAERGLSKRRQEVPQNVASAVPRNMFDRANDNDSDDDSELEWEGWTRDLERQVRVRRDAHTSSISTPLPSPPLSDASSTGSPIAPSLPLPHASGTNSSSPAMPYPNISNVIENSVIIEDRSSVETARLPERMKTTTISTVSVGPATPVRRRSSTITTGVVSKLVKDKDKADKAPVTKSRTSPGPSSHRSVPSTSMRRPSSSVKLQASSSPLTSDIAESRVHQGEAPSPGVPPKRQSAFVRGVSLRAEKIVKRLDSAIDFVDGKNT